MFDIGFTEIFIIAVVALIVIGPERLPRVAKTLGHLFGRMQRYVAEVKADVSREIELDELRNLKSTMQDAARSFEQSVTSQVNFIESEVKEAGADVQKQVESVVAPLSGIQLMPEEKSSSAESVPAERGPESASQAAEQPQLDLALEQKSEDGKRD